MNQMKRTDNLVVETQTLIANKFRSQINLNNKVQGRKIQGRHHLGPEVIMFRINPNPAATTVLKILTMKYKREMSMSVDPGTSVAPPKVLITVEVLALTSKELAGGKMSISIIDNPQVVFQFLAPVLILALTPMLCFTTLAIDKHRIRPTYRIITKDQV